MTRLKSTPGWLQSRPTPLARQNQTNRHSSLSAQVTFVLKRNLQKFKRDIHTNAISQSFSFICFFSVLQGQVNILLSYFLVRYLYLLAGASNPIRHRASLTCRPQTSSRLFAPIPFRCLQLFSMPARNPKIPRSRGPSWCLARGGRVSYTALPFPPFPLSRPSPYLLVDSPPTRRPLLQIVG
jgi:hypothetical protein